MLLFGIAGFFLFSSVTVEFNTSSQQDKYPESVLFLSKQETSKIFAEAGNFPLTRRGPVWADPVQSGMEGDLFFHLGAGLSTKSKPLSFMPDGPIGSIDDPVWRLDMAPVRVEAWLTGDDADSGPVLYEPVVEAWSENLAEYREKIPSAGCGMDLRGQRVSFWVRTNEWGVPIDVLVMESSDQDDVDKQAEKVVRNLRWPSFPGGREGMLTIDWKEKEAE